MNWFGVQGNIGYIGIMEKKMETTLMGFYRVKDLGCRVHVMGAIPTP